MQPLAFLWFEMQMTQQYLRKKTLTIGGFLAFLAFGAGVSVSGM